MGILLEAETASQTSVRISGMTSLVQTTTSNKDHCIELESLRFERGDLSLQTGHHVGQQCGHTPA